MVVVVVLVVLVVGEGAAGGGVGRWLPGCDVSLILEEHRSFLVPVPGQSQASRGRAMGNTEKSGRWCESVWRGCRQEQEGGTRVVPVCAKNERGERSGGLKVACV